ncbi:phosphoserine phosphatase SerB [Kribbella aluminosa]|uniref:phosphoserine phosphatase n=1 Tax=Kribbella aluminosa TaxID=416017 RepID=A0ABS4UCY7_9ACTN|nr:HAD-IB family phosphatase [Kribbella aluminosa]MBP2349497.1 phosphoserine phosphatase SerB [Kribbella aluminosa]
MYAGHLDLKRFRGSYPSWARLMARLHQISTPRFTADRGKRQLAGADFLSQLNHGTDAYEKTGSDALPGYAEAWSGTSETGLDPVYEMARTANDLDIYNGALDDLTDRQYLDRIRADILAVAPMRQNPVDGAAGLGGLVRYTTRSIEIAGNGHAVFTIDVQPVDDSRGPLGVRADGDLFSIEVDVKMPTMIQRTSESERARRSIVGAQLDGVQPITPLMRPVADLAADKMAALALQPGVGDGIAAPRFKDIADLYYIARTCPLEGDALRKALAENWHWQEAGLSGPPRPYRFYGQAPAPAHETEILWEHGFRQLRGRIPQLREYPEFATMVETIGTFLDGAADPSNGTWDPVRGQWQQNVRSEVASTMDHALAPVRTPEQAHQPMVPMQKHLIVFDVDQTISKYDTLHTLAERAGRLAEVDACRHPDYETSIRAKVAELRGVDAALVRDVADTIVLNEGVEELIRDLKAAGHEVAIASGGFDAIVGPLAERLGVEQYAAGRLGIEDGVLTGEVSNLVDADGKVEFIEKTRAELGIPRERTIAVGDGSNDVPMLQNVGFGAGYEPGQAAAGVAHTIIHGDMSQLKRALHLPAPNRPTPPARPTTPTPRFPPAPNTARTT